MSNFRFIHKDLDVSNILQQVLDNPTDWKSVSTYEHTGGDKDPPGFLPMIMAVVKDGENPKNSELLAMTPLAEHYPAIFNWLKSQGITRMARSAFFKLPVNSCVATHIDDGTYYLTKDRFHLSLQGRYLYTVDDEEHIIEPGTFFWFDNKKPHSALNVDSVDRITFVFDVPHDLDHPANSKIYFSTPVDL
jgi:hypothetical protein